MMADGNRGRALPSGDVEKKTVAEPPPDILDRTACPPRLGWDVFRPERKRNSLPRAQRMNEISVRGRFRANLMIQMRGDHVEAQRSQRQQQRQAVGAAARPNHDPIRRSDAHPRFQRLQSDQRFPRGRRKRR